MELKLFKTLWGHTGSYADAAIQAGEAGMQGLEGAAPMEQEQRDQLLALLAEYDLAFIAEITTAGSYVPDREATLAEHLASFRQKLQASVAMQPLFVTCLGGCDAWPEPMSIDFFGQAMQIADEYCVQVSFETHRGRSLFNPWVTQRIIGQLPDMQLTCDFSHWCVVCERLMDTELDVIGQVATRAHHVHARVGYDQGPQVPNPAAPEYEYALRAHQRWWEMIWRSQRERGYSLTTMTPEFGPDGYLHEAPFTCQPVADLWELNTWMAAEERRHFAGIMP